MADVAAMHEALGSTVTEGARASDTVGGAAGAESPGGADKLETSVDVEVATTNAAGV